MIRRPPIAIRTYTLFPYTALVRSRVGIGEGHRQADAIGGLRQRVAVAEYDDVGVMGAVHRAGAQFRPDAGRFARDQREPGAHRSAAAAARGSRCTDVDVGFAAHLAQEAVPLVLQLALADALAHLRTAVVVGDVGLAGFLALDEIGRAHV